MFDFEFYLEPPLKDASGLITITPLSPLSMASGQPGSYYQSLRVPGASMLYGLLENALGWHFGDSLRRELFASLQKQVKKLHKKNNEWKESPWLTQRPQASGCGFLSLLQHHLSFEKPIFEPATLTYDDLWSQSLRDEGRSFFGGSRNYDAGLENIMTRARRKEVEFSDRGNASPVSPEEFHSVENGTIIRYSSVRSGFPQYYSSPKKREYVEVKSDYLFRFTCTRRLATMIQHALLAPEAPLHLGTNDGWVSAQIELMP